MARVNARHGRVDSFGICRRVENNEAPSDGCLQVLAQLESEALKQKTVYAVVDGAQRCADVKRHDASAQI